MNELNSTNYYQLREELVERNANLVGVVLNNAEKALDGHLTQLKDEFRNACGGNVPFEMPVLTDSRIWNSRLYTFCKALPKGSDLHVHGAALLPARKVIDFVLEHENLLINIDTCILTLDSTDSRAMSLKEAFWRGYLTREKVERVWTVLGCGEDKDIWQYFEGLFAYHRVIGKNMELLYDYYLYALEDYVHNGIFHLEIHVLLSADWSAAEQMILTMRKAYYDVKKKYPQLIVSVIGSSMKMFTFSIENTQAVFENTVRAQKEILDESDPENICPFVLGFDLVNEEDTSRPLREYAPMLLDFKKSHPDFRYYLHCGESLNAESDNLIDAYLIGASRVGHGMNLYRYPNLLKNYADREICLESCLISNQTLRYTRDIRLHPSQEYLRRGVVVALCSDDPVFQEHEELVDDFFAAIISWNLGVAEIKQLALNSILYSGLDDASRRKLMFNWGSAWKTFVQNALEI